VLPAITQLEFNPAATETAAATIGKSFDFNFNTGEFVLEDGNVVETEDTEAVKVWVEKILRTERYQYKIYERDDDNEYGVTIEDLIGGVYPKKFIEAELKREITEAVTRHPNISSISNLSTEQDGAKLDITFTINLTSGASTEVTVSG
jgi:Protein of unknown function (DUF2634).